MISTSLKIAQISSTFPPYAGGTGNVAQQLCRGLVKSGHQVSLYTVSRKGAPEREVRDGVSIHRLNPLFRSGNSAALPQLAWQLGSFDLIHLHYPFLGGEACALAAFLTGTPLVVSYHMDLVLQGQKITFERIYRATLGRFILRQAAAVLYSSMDYAENSTSRRLLTRYADRIDVLPNGVDTHTFFPAPASQDLEKRFRSDPSTRIVLLVATLDRAHYFKGVDIFVEAIARLPEWVKGIVVGEGDLRHEYMRLAESSGIDGRVYFPGRISDRFLPDYYRLADLFVLPSTTMGEAFGLVLVEAMACGTPVIASNLPGVRSVVSEGEDGFLVLPGDPASLAAKISFFLDLPVEKRWDMGTAGRRKAVEQFDWVKIIHKLEEVYAEVLSG